MLLTQFWPNFFGPIFESLNFFGPKFCFTQIFWTQQFLDQNFFAENLSISGISQLSVIWFWRNFLGNIYFNQNFWGPKLFLTFNIFTQHFIVSTSFLNQNYFWIKIFVVNDIWKIKIITTIIKSKTILATSTTITIIHYHFEQNSTVTET